MSLMQAVIDLFTADAGTLYPTNGVLSLLTTDARSCYPWPLMWGNALWGYVAWKMYRASLPKAQQPGMVFGCAITFILYTMPANIFTSLLILAKNTQCVVGNSFLVVELVSYALEFF